MHANEGADDTNTVTIKGGCLVDLTAEMFKRATHIWTKRAIFPIPNGAKQYEEEPPD